MRFTCLGMEMDWGWRIGWCGLGRWDGKGIQAMELDRRGKGAYDTPFFLLLFSELF